MDGQRYAFLTVSNSDGIVNLARGLQERYGIIATEGTAGLLRKSGVEVTDVAAYIGKRATMQPQGIKSIHHRVFDGILANPNDPQHLLDLAEFGEVLIDIVACNFYSQKDPSSKGIADPNDIDIGGPAAVCCAAKNAILSGRTTVLTDPADYQMVLDELAASGSLSAGTRLRLATKAFRAASAHYAAAAELAERLARQGRSATA